MGKRSQSDELAHDGVQRLRQSRSLPGQGYLFDAQPTVGPEPNGADTNTPLTTTQPPTPNQTLRSQQLAELEGFDDLDDLLAACADGEAAAERIAGTLRTCRIALVEYAHQLGILHRTNAKGSRP